MGSSRPAGGPAGRMSGCCVLPLPAGGESTDRLHVVCRGLIGHVLMKCNSVKGLSGLVHDRTTVTAKAQTSFIFESGI